jgi:hypothetical protein
MRAQMNLSLTVQSDALIRKMAEKKRMTLAAYITYLVEQDAKAEGYSFKKKSK